MSKTTLNDSEYEDKKGSLICKNNKSTSKICQVCWHRTLTPAPLRQRQAEAGESQHHSGLHSEFQLGLQGDSLKTTKHLLSVVTH